MTTVFFGDSIIAGWTLDDYFIGAINKGRLGKTPEQLLGYFTEDVIAELPEAVVICCGTNAPYPSSVPFIQEMVEAAQAEEIKVILCRIPPRSWDVSEFNDSLLAMALAKHFICVDFFGPMRLSDGSQNTMLFQGDYTHPNTAGYDVMAGVIKPALNAMLMRPMSAQRLEAVWRAL